MIIPFREKFEKIFAGQEKWYKKYLWFLLFFAIFFALVIIPGAMKEGLGVPKGRLFSCVGLFFFITTGLFILMSISDKTKQIKRMFLRVLTSMIMALIFFVWLIVTVVWTSGVLGL